MARAEGLADAGIVALAGMRIGIGALAWANPELTSRLFGFPAPDAQGRYLWRLFGVRDLAVGLGTVTSSGDRRRTWARVGMACDVADGAAGVLGRGGVSPASAAAMIGVPAAAVGFGAWALRPRG
ncbi:DUF4267 domain-containing protein [Mycolicibacterium sediminis]|uniref:DUF4267 domain-containing protein n=1 Tax=Mycolicibacterium sediminis TaxID=1286180 RepID=A0A7I7QRV2_9MYCO|nr:DUF4267 domain-containing protein [Mycolicibacterium sediminis]BBY29118.1 hypothetical protein MSEDJ_32140 [Mycolicibacterium sediminis]